MIKYNLFDDVHYGTEAERVALTLTAERQNYKFYCYDTTSRWIWSGTQWYAM